MEKDGGVDEDDENGRYDDGGSVSMLVEEDEVADEVNCCMGTDLENRQRLPPVSPRDSSVYSRINQVGELGLVSGETGDSNMGCVITGSQLAPCGGCSQPVGGVHRCPGCGAHMQSFCGDPVGEEGYGQIIRCPGCR